MKNGGHQRKIKLQNQNINYVLKISRKAKRMRLAVYCDGSLVVTRPMDLSQNIVEKFIIKKSNWIISKVEYFKQFKNDCLLKNSKKEYLKHKDNARKFVKRRVDYHNQNYGFKFNKINIKNQKTRWGSCSKKGNLNFNYKILLLPKQLANYIIVHELCHLKEFNHSQKFWNLVSKIMPNYLEARKELQDNCLKLY